MFQNFIIICSFTEGQILYIKTEKAEKNIIYSAQWILFTTNWLKIYMSDFFSIAKNVKKLKRKSFKKKTIGAFQLTAGD